MKQSATVAFVAGARPNYMKIAPIWGKMQKDPEAFTPVLVHTGQHYDEKMYQVFFDDLGMNPPDHFLGVGSASHAEQTARIMMDIEKVFMKVKPDLVIVVGDVNSTLAASLVAAKLLIPVAHIEAGLRSFDRTMPEEINRLVTDALSDHLFTTCRDADENLLKEGRPRERIHFVGNTMIDSLEKLLPVIQARDTVRGLGLAPGRYIAVTLHRPSNVDDPERLSAILAALANLSGEHEVLFPVHPRTAKAMKALSPPFHPPPGFHLVEPMGYLDFMNTVTQAAAVLTDSGGIQEETSYLGIPCLTLRPNTERPITIAQGTNRLVDLPGEAIEQALREALANRGAPRPTIELWDGHAAARIVAVLKGVLARS